MYCHAAEVPVGCLLVLPHMKRLLARGSGSLQGCDYAYPHLQQHGARMSVREELLQLRKKYMLLSEYLIAKHYFIVTSHFQV